MKKHLILLSGLVASSIVLTSFSRPAKDDVGQKYIDAGVNLVDVGEYRLAIKVLRDCDRPFADALRMEAYNGLDRPRKAIRYGVDYLDALGQQEVNDSTITVNSYVTVDVADILDKDWKYAAGQIRKRLAGQEYNTQLQMMLGSLYQINGHYKDAIEHYDKTIEYCESIGLGVFGTDWLYLWKSTCYYGLEDYDNAIKTISQAVDATFGKDYSHLCQRGFYYMQAGKYDEAMADYAKATGINPDNALAYFGKCAILYKQGKSDEAKTEYCKGIKIDPAMESLEYNEVLQEIVTGFSKLYKTDFSKSCHSVYLMRNRV